MRVDSGTSSDYMQLELLDGNILVVYNLGTEDIDISELGSKVNDGQYHIVRFTRSGQNSTLQIDNHNVLTKSPTGKQLNIFNSHAKVQIGGHKNVIRNSIEKPFIGILAGLVFNGHRLLDIAAEYDPRIQVEGDVEMMIPMGNNQPVLTTSSSHTEDQMNNQMLSEGKQTASGTSFTANDDLIYSGAGSGCYDVTEDEECARVVHEGSGDALITPVYVAVSRMKPTDSPTVYGPNKSKPSKSNCRRSQNVDDDDDDEDCVEGSGDNRAPQWSSNNRSSYYDYYSTSTYRPWTTWAPPTVPPMNRPPLYNKDHNYNGAAGGRVPPYFSAPNQPVPPTTFYSYGGVRSGVDVPYLRPKTTAPPWTKPVYSVSGPSRPINQPPQEPQGPPEIYDVPLNIPPVSNDTPSTQIPEVLSRSSSDRTVMIIGMIAICLIVVVIIAPIVLFFKVRIQSNDAAYKIESNFGPKLSTMPALHGTMYGGGVGMPGAAPFGPVVRAMSISGIPSAHSAHPGMMGQMNLMSNSLVRSRPGTRPGTPTGDMSMNKKNPHEWYV